MKPVCEWDVENLMKMEASDNETSAAILMTHVNRRCYDGSHASGSCLEVIRVG